MLPRVENLLEEVEVGQVHADKEGEGGAIHVTETEFLFLIKAAVGSTSRRESSMPSTAQLMRKKKNTTRRRRETNKPR